MVMNREAYFAFAGGSESKESVRRLYIGVAPVYVLAVNPGKEEMERLYNTTIEEAPNYLGESEVGPEGNKVKLPQARIDFIVRTDPSKSDGIDMTTRVSFFVVKSFRYNKDNTKVEVINKYGDTTWLPVDTVKGQAPVPDNMNWYDTSGMRPAYIGEADLTQFIKKYLNIPNVSFTTKTGEKKTIPNPADAEARLDKVESYFTGDFTELRSIIKLQPNNMVRCMFGVRTSNDNNQYQAVYTQKMLKLNDTNYSRLDKDLQDRKQNGAYPTTEFSVEPLHEYTVQATDFSQPKETQAPKDNPWNKWNQ